MSRASLRGVFAIALVSLVFGLAAGSVWAGGFEKFAPRPPVALEKLAHIPEIEAAGQALPPLEMKAHKPPELSLGDLNKYIPPSPTPLVPFALLSPADPIVVVPLARPLHHTWPSNTVLLDWHGYDCVCDGCLIENGRYLCGNAACGYDMPEIDGDKCPECGHHRKSRSDD